MPTLKAIKSDTTKIEMVSAYKNAQAGIEEVVFVCFDDENYILDDSLLK